MFSFKRQIGNQAEAIALDYLSGQGMQLIEQNYLTPLGEIDIIMLDKVDNELVFVEVRYRNNTEFGSASETVNYKKQVKITKTAQQYLQHQQQYENFTCRFDVVGVESNLKYPKINWIKNAF